MNWISLSALLGWNATWTFIWAGVNLFFTIMLFFGNRKDGLYRAMQAYVALMMLAQVRMGVLQLIDISHNPDPYYAASLIMAVLAPAGALASIVLAYLVWKARQ